MASDIRRILFPAPIKGMDNVTPPHLLKSGFVPYLKNYLCTDSQRAVLRSPLTTVTVPGSTTLYDSLTVVPCGAWTLGGKMLIGRVGTDSTARKEYWQLPHTPASAANQLADSYTTDLVHYDGTTGTRITSAVTAELIPGPRFTRYGKYVYGIAYDSTTEVDETSKVIASYVKRRKILRWDGTAVVPTAYAGGPLGAMDITTHANRLFVLGGLNPDGAGSTQLNTLWWTEPFDGDNALADDTLVKATVTTAHTGANNDLKFTAVAGGAGGNKLSVVFASAAGATLTVTVDAVLNIPGTEQSITILFPTGGTTTAAAVAAAVAAYAPAAALVTVANAGGNDGTGFVADTAFLPLTGGSGTSPWVDAATGDISQIVLDNGDPDDYCVGLARSGNNLAILRRNSIDVLYGDGPETFSWRPIVRDVGCIDFRTIVEMNGGIYFLSDRGYHFFDGQRVVNQSSQILELQKNSSAVNGGVRSAINIGDDTIMLVINSGTLSPSGYLSGTAVAFLFNTKLGAWSYLTTQNAIARFLGGEFGSILFHGTGSQFWVVPPSASAPVGPASLATGARGFDGTSTPLAAEIRFPLAGLGSAPSLRSQQHRAFVDYFWQRSSSVSADETWDPASPNAGTSGQTLTIVDDLGATIKTVSTGLPAQGTASTRLHRLLTADVFEEITEAQLRLAYSGSTSYSKAEIYSTGLEYQAAARRHGG